MTEHMLGMHEALGSIRSIRIKKKERKNNKEKNAEHGQALSTQLVVECFMLELGGKIPGCKC